MATKRKLSKHRYTRPIQTQLRRCKKAERSSLSASSKSCRRVRSSHAEKILIKSDCSNAQVQSEVERMGGACKNYPKLIRVGQSQSVCSDLNSNSNRIDWRSFCKLWRQWTSCSMTVLLGTRAGLHVEVLHKAKSLVALRLWVPLESSACFVCHAFPCAKMCQTTEAFWAFAFFIYNASPYRIEYEKSILQAAHQQQLQVHFLSGILKHWQIKSLIDLRSSDSKNINHISIISIQLLASQAESSKLLYCSPILGPSDKYKYKWHQVISSDVSRTNRFWWIHDSHAPVAIAVFQLLPESSLPQITHCGRAPWLLHAF